MVPAPINSTRSTSKDSSAPIGGVIVDIGTGDGAFVYRLARQNPDRFYIGIDSSAGGVRKISEKIHRRPAKGGVPNALFVHASVEDLPHDLDGVADEIHIHFPWAGLLRGVARGEEATLSGLRRIAADRALLEVVIGIDFERDRAEVSRLELPPLTPDYVESALKPRFRDAGFEVKEYGWFPPAEWPDLHTSWSQRLKRSTNRSLFFLVAQAAPLNQSK